MMTLMQIKSQNYVIILFKDHAYKTRGVCVKLNTLDVVWDQALITIGVRA